MSNNKYDWVKKLGQWHRSTGNNPTTDCGMAMLGNNYASVIPIAERVPCEKCFSEAETVQPIEHYDEDVEIFESLMLGGF